MWAIPIDRARPVTEVLILGVQSRHLVDRIDDESIWL
ncbi:hypothetical protein SAMN04488026_11613 [Aliiruegeria lutimaris]|uniref:Uncharacterized protein n=1 Tax=Aliiruegeria lutimaris TaxID=571298 RepID=A0A1G9Q7T9_9RHOB|nr:hypothetical protein SAMN04488026_11613 [Aliiruegeria lutimaris]